MNTRYFIHSGLGVLWFGEPPKELELPTAEELITSFILPQNPSPEPRPRTKMPIFVGRSKRVKPTQSGGPKKLRYARKHN